MIVGNSLLAVADVFVAPSASAERAVKSPSWLLPAVVSMAMVLAGYFLVLHNQTLVSRGWSPAAVFESTGEVWAGSVLWAFLCFAIIGVFTSATQVPAKSWSLACTASVALIGLPILTQGVVTVLAAMHAGQPIPHIQLLLPSLAWIRACG